MKYTVNTEFPHSWKDIDKKGNPISCITQPYIVGLYLAINDLSGRNLFQSSMSYNQSKTLLRKLKEDKTVSDLVTGKLGDFLNERDLEILNS
jgi:hypothetical protein